MLKLSGMDLSSDHNHFFAFFVSPDAITAMTLVVPFAMGLVASTPLLPMWPTAHFLEFAGPTLSGPMGDAPASICGWTPTCTRKDPLVYERTKACVFLSLLRDRRVVRERSLQRVSLGGVLARSPNLAGGGCEEM